MIPENSDLNDYTTVGNYYQAGASAASTIANVPVSGAFNMKVFYGNGSSYPIQLFFTHNGRLCMRAYNSDSGSWRDWNTIV